MKLNKLALTALAIVLVLCMAACSSGPDITALTESYNTLSANYNDMIDVATENGWDQDAEVLAGFNNVAEKINKTGELLSQGVNPNATQEEIDAAKQSCDDMIAWVATALEMVSEPYPAE